MRYFDMLQGTINWFSVHEKSPKINELYCVMYSTNHRSGVSFAKMGDDGIWLDEYGRVFTDGFIRYYGRPEMTILEQEVFFTTKIAHKMCGIKRRQFFNWIADMKINGRRDDIGHRWLFSLHEINRVRKQRGLEKLTYNEAIIIWEQEVNND